MPEVGVHDPTITRLEIRNHGAKTRVTLSDGPYPAGRDHAEAGVERRLRQPSGACRRINPDCIARSHDDG